MSMKFGNMINFTFWESYGSKFLNYYNQNKNYGAIVIILTQAMIKDAQVFKGSDRAALLKLTKLIIWDEAPMAHKFYFEALDRTLKDIMTGSKSSSKIFGGKVIVFGGDFR